MQYSKAAIIHNEIIESIANAQ